MLADKAASVYNQQPIIQQAGELHNITARNAPIGYEVVPKQTRKPRYRKETARCRSYSFRFKVCRPLQRTPTNIRINLILSEAIESLAYIPAADIGFIFIGFYSVVFEISAKKF